MSLILTSDFPSTPVHAVAHRLTQIGPSARVAWIPPFTDSSRDTFRTAQQQFRELGVEQLEYCDIDQDIDEVQLAYLSEYDAVYLGGGDPIRFRYNLLRSGAGGRVGQCIRAGRLVVAASGGALQLTQNVSLFRLQSESLAAVLATRDTYTALGAVPYEILPHVNVRDAAFLETVRSYSEHVDHEIVGLADGGALLHDTPATYESIGNVVRFHKGVRG
ncbi:MAG: Type 1 glutamine amidotransferase-like domain-containing protein [Acidobacteria bacterium]|nr:Type 1 glutamine amidotransferase-like domain-containing protein [Acidobacteriota bacterium]